MAKNERGWLERQARDRTECESCLFKGAACIECDKMALRWAWYYFCLEMPLLKKLARVPHPCMLNTISLRGILMDKMTTTTSVGGGTTYHGTVSVQRLSGTVDYLPVVIEGAKFPNLDPFSLIGNRVTITGEIRTYTRNDQEVGHRHKVCVFVQSIYKVPDGAKDDQLLALEGNLCKPPVYRVTPNGREICELLVACNVGTKANYIPVIVWGFSARKMAGAQTGDLVELSGRFQSRKYEKKLDFTGESGEPIRVWRTAYEVSAKSCRVIGMQRRLKAE